MGSVTVFGELLVIEAKTQPSDESDALQAVFVYMGILDAYEAVGAELIGPDAFDEHVLPRMVYYINEFLPELFSDQEDRENLVKEMRAFLEDFKREVHTAMESGSPEGVTMEDIWKLRAAIFGYESVFINILGETAIKNYVFVRMADILSAYLPASLLDSSVPLEQKLRGYADFIKKQGFVKYARVTFDDDRISVAANKCAFARIHDSSAYRDLHVRFCPWGMIASAIVAAHERRETVLESSMFTTSGSISKIRSKEER